MTNGSGQAGFTYLGVLFLVSALGAGVAATAEVWSNSRQREKEAELLWAGNQFRHAIGLYYQRSPGSVKRYPETLEDLLQDRRFPNTQRYLRRIYADPMNRSSEWGLIRAPEGGIAGVHSLSEKRPIKQIAMDAKSGTPVPAATYRDWQFVYRPPEALSATLRR